MNRLILGITATAFLLSACVAPVDEDDPCLDDDSCFDDDFDDDLADEQDEEQNLGQDSSALMSRGTTGGSCTIETCDGLKNPFGTLTCFLGFCLCTYGSTTAACNSSGCYEIGCQQQASSGGGVKMQLP